MKISIITVCFNSEATIGDTLQSVGEQRYADIEHIIVDGNSTDNTIGIVRSLSSRVSQLLSEPDAGIYDAMNKGIGLATGQFVGFLNADDVLAGPDTIAHIAAKAAFTGADAVYGDLAYVRKDCSTKVLRYWESGRFDRSRLRYGWMPPHPTFYVRRSTLQKVGQFDLRFRIAADYDFMLRCLGQSDFRVAYIPEVLVHMRMGGASNRSLGAMMQKSREDLITLRKNRVGGVATLFFKNARKFSQFFKKRPQAGLAVPPE